MKKVLRLLGLGAVSAIGVAGLAACGGETIRKKANKTL